VNDYRSLAREYGHVALAVKRVLRRTFHGESGVAQLKRQLRAARREQRIAMKRSGRQS
jgi:hypothetical protein